MQTRYLLLVLLWVAVANSVGLQDVARAESARTDLHKVKDLVIYRHARFYAAFPSIVTRPSGELIVAFRRAPEHRFVRDGGGSHTDPNSYLVLVRSADNAESWTTDPELIYAHPWGGSQDPCMVQLRDGTIVCSSYAWYMQRNKAFVDPPESMRSGAFIFMGGYLMRSADGGHSWDGPITPPPVPGCKTQTIFGEPCPAYNRGAMCQGKDGRLYWAVAARANKAPFRTEIHLLVSEDRGTTWEYRCPIARDADVTFNETSLIETPSGQLVAFMRTADFKDHTTIARSKDGGRSFQPWEDVGFQGHPHHALRLPDKRVLLVYGYRHKPYGIRARVFDAECRNIATAKEIVLRDDGGSGDLGYPWATVMADGRILVVYYFNKNGGVRHIAGTILALGTPQLHGAESDVVAPGAAVKQLADGFLFTEGPACDRAGNVYFTDQPNDRIMKWSIDGKLSTFKQPCGRANGLYFDKAGSLWACADEKNELWRIDLEGTPKIVVKDFEDKLLNGPNDLWIRPDGGIYFTDPFYSRKYWNRGPQEQSCQGVYFVTSDRKTVVRVIDDLKTPNGLIGTPDGTVLYVADLKAGKTYAYDIQTDGSLKGKRLFCELGSDGMTLDDEGNVYLTGKGVTVFNAQGVQIRHIPIDARWTANVCFGGKDRKTLFVTASQGLFGLRMRVRGVGPR